MMWEPFGEKNEEHCNLKGENDIAHCRLAVGCLKGIGTALSSEYVF